MPRTVILQTLINEILETIKENWTNVKEYTMKLQKTPKIIDFENISNELQLTEEQYILAIRSNLTRQQIFLKRSSFEVDINGYNENILNSFESNMDLQFVLDPHSCAYFISKVDAGLTKLLRKAANDVEGGNKGIKKRLRTVGNTFLKSNVVSAQEAAYHILSLPLSKSSRGSTYINTSLINERVIMLKPASLLKTAARRFQQSVSIKYPNPKSIQIVQRTWKIFA